MKNKAYRVETIEKCTRFLAACREHGYYVWQMQYQWNMPEGFRAWFHRPQDPNDIEVVTHCKKVQKAIVGFNSQKG